MTRYKAATSDRQYWDEVYYDHTFPKNAPVLCTVSHQQCREQAATLLIFDSHHSPKFCRHVALHLYGYLTFIRCLALIILFCKSLYVIYYVYLMDSVQGVLIKPAITHQIHAWYLSDSKSHL